MYTVDLHTHTRFFHGRRELGDRFDPVGYRLLATAARLRGLDGVATTNHDYYTAFPDALGTTALPGTEITTTRGHLLVIGPDPPAETDPGELTPEAAVEAGGSGPTTSRCPRVVVISVPGSAVVPRASGNAV